MYLLHRQEVHIKAMQNYAHWKWYNVLGYNVVAQSDEYGGE